MTRFCPACRINVPGDTPPYSVCHPSHEPHADHQSCSHIWKGTEFAAEEKCHKCQVTRLVA